MMNDKLPVGYLRCIECGKPALWLIDNMKYTPSLDDDVTIHLKYKLINLKVLDYDPVTEDYFICDNCGCKIPNENYTGDYLVFLDSFDVEDTMQ